MGAWVLIIFMANGTVTSVPGFRDFDSCVAAQQGVNIAGSTLYPPERSIASYCFPTSKRAAIGQEPRD